MIVLLKIIRIFGKISENTIQYVILIIFQFTCISSENKHFSKNFFVWDYMSYEQYGQRSAVNIRLGGLLLKRLEGIKKKLNNYFG